ncbi:LacI family DNA-binding transcriptional regulator [Microbacterium oryzae]|uniref:LacI family DNA-binding transcriptional regulator n=1 Tax=Microbacterium oryzae TaxID=743009 RepID=UPI0025B0E600|nr:LacI family DNA-binding transcriptional regulator [Microbacterium oryzae]MDN3311271.1 LacI family DNA-binding transcriptional regulator [Microbacterium oryzae]
MAEDPVPARTRRRRSTENRPVSMADVAQRAGVSAQTVSRVANGFGGVLDETRAAVIAAMEELGYRPNSAARALKLGSFRTIGVISSTLSTIGDVRTIEAIAHSAALEGYTTTLIPLRAQGEGGVKRVYSRLQELAVDALILNIEKQLLDRAEVLVPPGVPIVLMDTSPDGMHVVVDTDQFDGARQATGHLLSLGHETVRHLAGPEESHPAQRRLEGWQRTLEDAGRPVPEPLRGDWTAQSGYELGRILADDPSCTAVFCANDQMALGLYRALREAGRRVPQDVSVVGFDDTADAIAYDPPLTSVHQDFADAGRRAVSAALAQLRAGEESTPRIDVVPTGLIVRASTAALSGVSPTAIRPAREE